MVTALPKSERAAVAPSATVSGGRISSALLLDPPAAGLDLAGVGLGVDAALAALLELEMLDRVGDVGRAAVDPGLAERAVEQLAGRADERAAGEILLVARLLADEQDPGVERAFAEHGLGRAFVEVAAGAAHRLVAHRLPGASRALPPTCPRPMPRPSSPRAPARPAISSATNAVSGMFFQYFFGISFSIAPILSRAGLKIEA